MTVNGQQDFKMVKSLSRQAFEPATSAGNHLFSPNSNKLGVFHGLGGRAPCMHQEEFHPGCLALVLVLLE